MKYLPTFFRTCAIEIKSTLDNMVIKTINYNDISCNNNIHLNRELVYQFYSIGTHNFLPYAANCNTTTYWFISTLQNFQIHTVNLYYTTLN